MPTDWLRDATRACGRVGVAPYSLRIAVMFFLPLMLLWAPRPMHFTPSTRWTLLWVCAAALTLGSPVCLGIAATERESQRRGNSPATTELSREGTRVVGLVGTFREIARRWTFIADDSQVAYRLLENQSLERVCRAIKEDPRDIRWKVGGQLTEFMDENFLMLDHTQRAPD